MENSRFITNAIYQHYKTRGFYRVLCECKHTETNEDMVLYRAVNFDETKRIETFVGEKKILWARSKNMFLSKVGDCNRFDLVYDIHNFKIVDGIPEKGDYFIDMRGGYDGVVYICDNGATNNFILTSDINHPIESVKKVEYVGKQN